MIIGKCRGFFHQYTQVISIRSQNTIYLICKWGQANKINLNIFSNVGQMMTFDIQPVQPLLSDAILSIFAH